MIILRYLLLPILLLPAMNAPAASPDLRVFEMRTYHAAPGKLDALHSRFRDHTLRLFAKHGINSLGYWVPVENPDNLLIFVLAYPSREARETTWKAFVEDPEWKTAKAESEKEGALVSKADQHFLTATDYSPPIQPGIDADGRIFELRTYTTPPGRLDALHARFRDHTTRLFAKHGMTNLFYWHLLPDQPAADVTLIYLLAHQSTDAARASFAAFRADADWIAARTASEQKAGGSLTIAEGGVKSLFLKATDYSPTR
jgi:hypothetical protein